MSWLSWVSAAAATGSIAVSVTVAGLAFANGGSRLPLDLGEGVVVMAAPLGLSTLSALLLPIGLLQRPIRTKSALVAMTILSWLTLFAVFGAAGFYNLF